jgi:hypothetical protein
MVQKPPTEANAGPSSHLKKSSLSWTLGSWSRKAEASDFYLIGILFKMYGQASRLLIEFNHRSLKQEIIKV